MVEIKFCGLTRPEDALHASRLEAAYVGVIFAASPRQLSDDRARLVYAAAARPVRRVGVFGHDDMRAIAKRATDLGLDVVQLHGDPDAAAIERLRRHWPGELWAVQRVRGSEVPDTATELFALADAVVLDARVDGRLGGTGVVLPWKALRERIAGLRAGEARLVLAGGLTPENVADAVDALGPDVVDVSSGVESDVGVKDHGRMRAFRDAVHWARAR